MDARSFLQVCACLRQMFTGGESCVIASCVVESYVMQSDAMWPAGTAKRRAIAWTIGGLLVLFSSCRPPQSVPQPARLPEPGVYVLRRVSGLPLPADLKPPDYDPRRGSNFFERVLAGRLYLTPDRDYQTVICSDLVDSAGRASNQSTGLGGEGNKYWLAGGRVYFSDVLADALPDSTVVGVRGDTVEFAGQLFTRDRGSVLPHFPVIVGIVCQSLRASPGWAHPGAE
jgi:hypothetical protein